MIEQGALQTVYIFFAFAVQILLIADFAARVWKPALELRWGGLIYTLVGIAGSLLGVLLVVNRQPWYLAAGPLLLAIWATLGYAVDIWRPVNWRNPPHWRIFIPYVSLYVTALLTIRRGTAGQGQPGRCIPDVDGGRKMMHDISTMFWKERKGLLMQGGSRWRAVVTVLIMVVMIGVFFPLQMGRDWLDTGWSLLAAFLFPLILVGITIPESFAGERERHTLSTLLASRLPDRAIFFGKLGLAIGYGWLSTLLILLVSAVVVNVLFWEGRVVFYAPGVILADVATSFLMACLAASLGVLISLRSATAQGAQQALMFLLLIPLMALQLIPIVLLSLVPNGREIFRQLIEETDFGTLMLVVVAVLVVINVGLLLAAIARFKRARLILS